MTIAEMQQTQFCTRLFSSVTWKGGTNMVAEFEPVDRARTAAAADDVGRSLGSIASGQRLIVRLTRWMQRVVTPAGKA